jgi:hypothetical protein
MFSMPMLFTPKDKEGVRMEMDVAVISGDPFARGLGFRGIVEDQKTRERFKVYGASCSLPHCQCDARIEEI